MSANASSQRRPIWTPEARLDLLALVPAFCAMVWLVAKARWFWTRNPELQFGWIVAMLCAYLFYEAWEVRPAACYRWSPGALVSAGIALGVLFLTQIYQNAYGLTPASISGLAAGTLLLALANLQVVFGKPGMRHFGFSFLFILVAMPIPSALYSPIVVGLQSFVSSINVEVLTLLGIPAQRQGSLIQLSTCSVGVDEACSGVRSLQSTIMASLFIGYLILKSTALRVMLVGLGVALAVFGNLCRSLFLSLKANAGGPHAIEKYHDAAGWSILAFTAAGVGVLSWLLARLEQAAEAASKSAALAESATGSDRPNSECLPRS